MLVADEARGLACRIYDPAQDKMVATFFYRYLKQLEMLRDEAERLRLLYVAATRAQDLLIISGQVTCKAGEALSSKGWLSRLLEGFELTSEMEPGDDLVHDYSWGSIRVMIPAGRPKRNDDEYTPRDGVRQAPVDAEPVQPYLLTPITWQPAEQIRHIAATHIADLGSATSAYLPAEQRFYRERFRRRVLYDAPNVVESLNGEEGPSPIYAYQIGEIVHEALRHWHLPGRMPDDQLDELLTAYAWRLGITAPVALQEATNRSRRLLSNFAQSPLYHQISEAEAVYRELPFIYERDGFVIHGVIDLLCRLSDGRWVLLDYKTSNFPNTLSAEIHARRYHLQIGVYADAVTRQLNGIVPETYIHYIRRMKSVQVSAQDWGSALERSIASHIQSIIEERSE
ncbi:MAG: PD-(D/E)XK nuclease family protein [Chloroflexota bacterium]